MITWVKHAARGASCLALALAQACGGGTPAPSAPEHGSSRDATTHGLDAREHLLFRPRGNAAELLGRPVIRTDAGRWVIADEHAPGCNVTVKRIPERSFRKYVEDLESVGGAGIDFGEIAKLKARFGAKTKVEVTIHNVERLDADIDGDCGERYVASVRVGTGSRLVATGDQQEGAGGLTVLGVGAEGDAARAHSESTAFRWDEPQAWSYTVGGGQKGKRIDLNAGMPTVLTDGQLYRITVLPNRPVWLIVYYREENGGVGKLLPNMQHQVIHVGANEHRELPELRAMLTDPTKPAQEWINIVAFDHPEFLARFAPPSGDPSPAQMIEWHKTLKARLDDIGRRHYRHDEIGYRIVPKPTVSQASP